MEREGQITERFTRAIDQLGNEKLDVRLGGIYALRPTRTLDSHASRLRRKLNPNGKSTYIVNVWGVGYRLVPAA